MDNGDFAMVLYNSGRHFNKIKAKFEVFGYGEKTKVHVRDLWNKTDVGVFKT